MKWIEHGKKSAKRCTVTRTSKQANQKITKSGDAKWWKCAASLILSFVRVHVSRIVEQPNSFYWALLATLFIIRNNILFVGTSFVSACGFVNSRMNNNSSSRSSSSNSLTMTLLPIPICCFCCFCSMHCYTRITHMALAFRFHTNALDDNYVVLSLFMYLCLSVFILKYFHWILIRNK